MTISPPDLNSEGQLEVMTCQPGVEYSELCFQWVS